ncbi:MAG TPA: XdhC family protein [Thermoanaerobaculia bacterium]|nr:XdhC family protein [Thermoanaerobaculia bacterium]
MSELRILLDALAAREYERAVMITLVKLEGTGYRKAGARMIITDDGWSCGAVSGGCIEGVVRDHAKRVIAGDVSETIEVDTTSDTDLLFGSGLGCPGKLQFLFEPFRRDDCESRFGALRDALPPPIALHIFGAGNDAIPMAALSMTMGWETSVYDARETFLTRARFAEPVRLVSTHPTPLTLHAHSAAVVTTHNYFLDLDWLRHLLRSNAGYVAIVGSLKRFEMLRGVLREEGFDVSRLRGPAGLDIGSETPAEIALSVIAEAKAALAGRDGAPLSRRLHETTALA